MSAESDFDYWTQEPNAAEKPPVSSFQVEAIGGVEPLGVQFGVIEQLTVPVALQDILFGQPEPG